MAITTHTDSDKVRALLLPGDDYDEDEQPSLTRFINAAAIVVAKMITCAAAKGADAHSSDELIEIETWLAAHFFKMSDQQAQSESTEGASYSGGGQRAMYLDATFYGQTAQMLDDTGCLGGIGKQARISVKWLGLPPSEQTDYADRD